LTRFSQVLPIPADEGNPETSILRIQLASSELRRLLPAQPGTAAHCHRVAALSREMASRLPLSWKALNTLEHAALLHHTSPILLEIPPDLSGVLRLFHAGGRGEGDRTARTLACLLLLADSIDQQFESLAWEPRPLASLWEELEQISGLAGELVWNAGCAALREPYRVTDVQTWDLPVHAPIMKEVITGLCAKPDCDVAFLAKLAARDPVLAGNVLTTANSAWFGRRTPVRSVSQALAYIGADEGRRVLLALALKPLYGSARLAALWRHSIEMASLCESLAIARGFLKPAEALMLGLVHDVGRVALLRHSSSANRAFGRLTSRQCPPVYAEQLLFGKDHGEIGAEILESWGLPADLIAAVRHHHAPADCESLAASALYLAEFWSACDEDLPSARHLDYAQRRLGCSLEMLAQIGRGASSLSDLLSVA
jgi:putative nucleotidyltransferase with HDIG domain